MTLALLTVLLSVAAGAGLAFLGGRDRRHLARVVDSFSLVACMVVVIVHLLPHAISRAGLLALLPFAAALLIPLYFERWAHQRAGEHSHGRAALEIGYAGLLLHQMGDGLGLGTFASGAHEGHDHVELAVAIFAHTVPVAAVVTLAFIRHAGARSALLRAAGLAGAGFVGVALAGGTPSAFLAVSEPWVTAVVAGLLLHVITHDFRPEGGRGTSARLAELVALVLGVGLVLLGAGDHGHHEADGFRVELERALSTLGATVAPTVLLGLVAGALVRALRVPMPGAFFEGRDRKHGVPELFVVALAISLQLFGLLFSGLYLAVALLLAVAGARVAGVAPFVRRAGEGEGFVRAFRRDLDLLFTRLAPWLVFGLVAAAYASAGVASGAFEGMGALGVAMAAAIAFPIALSSAGGVVVMFVAVLEGLSPGAALASLVVGPATSLAVEEGVGERKKPARAASWGVWIAAVAIGVALDLTVFRTGPALEVPARFPRAIELAASAALGAAMLLILVRDGVRAFLGSLGESLSALPNGHDHGHDHGGHGHHAH